MSYDIHFQVVPEEEQRAGGRMLSFGYTGTLGVRGPQKLINKWIKCLLTPRGSNPLNRSEGTDFANLIGANMSSVQDVRDLVVLAVGECNDQIFAIDRRTAPPADERLLSATLSSFQALPDGFEAHISLKNVEGTVAVFPLPL